MEYSFRYGTSVPKEGQIQDILDTCEKLEREEKATVFDFGKDGDLVLHIYKDGDFDRASGGFNMVRVHTACGGEWVDDTYDTPLAGGILYQELSRIWNKIF